MRVELNELERLSAADAVGRATRVQAEAEAAWVECGRLAASVLESRGEEIPVGSAVGFDVDEEGRPVAAVAQECDE